MPQWRTRRMLGQLTQQCPHSPRRKVSGTGRSTAFASHHDEPRLHAPTNPHRQVRARVYRAVLTDESTASVGEAVAVAFIGRSNTRSFGQPTAGVPTGNVVYHLADGA